MRSHFQLLGLFLLPLALVNGQSESIPREELASPLKTEDFSAARIVSNSLLSNRQTCPGGYCEGVCMTIGGTCCNDGNGYCKAGYYCTATACCKKGSVCSGGAPAPIPTFSLPPVPTFSPPPSTGGGTCGVNQAPCDNGCMTLGNTCCNDGSGSCKPGYYCTATACCRIGQICSGGGGGGTLTSNPTGTAATTPTSTRSSSTADDTPDFGGATQPGDTTTSSSRTSTRSSTITAGATSAPPAFPGGTGAGAQLEPNAKLAAGLIGAVAGAAAILF